MKAMIFAAGLGTRLKPYTLSHPKALVPVGGIPMLQRVIIKLREAGVSEMVVNVHHFAQQIVDFLATEHNFGCDIHISDETDRLLDTGGGLLKARRWLDTSDEPIVIHNADILSDLDIAEMAECHRRTGATATLLVASRDTSRYLLMDHNMSLRGWINVSTGQTKPSRLCPDTLEKYAFGGVHVVSPAIFDSLEAYAPQETSFSITDYYIDNCRNIDIRGYMPAAQYRWLDIGKAQTLADAEKLFHRDKNL